MGAAGTFGKRRMRGIGDYSPRDSGTFFYAKVTWDELHVLYLDLVLLSLVAWLGSLDKHWHDRSSNGIR